MFNNIIYFILVLLIFHINLPDNSTDDSLLLSLTMFIITYLIFAGYCRYGFQGLQKQLSKSSVVDGSLTSRYHGLVAGLSVLAIFLFALVVHLLELKCRLQMIPGFDRFSVLQGILALTVFFIYLSTIWYFAYPVYEAIYQPEITKKSFILSNFRLNLPILFPWMVFSLVYDLIFLTPWAGTDGFLNRVGGQLIFFSGFFILMMIFLPGVIQYWWGCKPVEASEKGRQLEAFLQEKGFRYRHLLKWPIFEGRMMTAMLMGIVPRFRYILVTDSLLQTLSTEELKAVLAHEMGHAKYCHLLFYIIFFVGFMALSFGMPDLFFYLFCSSSFFMKMIIAGDSQAVNSFYMISSFPMLMAMFFYFRYVMGFFMRNFERQADLYSASVLGTPKPIISSLEKIAYLSGKSRSLPCWHHFSIKERVDCLWQTFSVPDLLKRQNRFVAVSFISYLLTLCVVVYFLNFSPMKQRLRYSMIGKALTLQVREEPDKIELYQNLAMFYHQMGKHEEAIHAYEKIIALDPNHALSLNNLAWIFLTAPNEQLRNKDQALELAKRAVTLEKAPAFLDTLAEAYYVNGLIQEAVKTIEEAITLATNGREYYERQLKKFLE